jgi:hypothetical protein
MKIEKSIVIKLMLVLTLMVVNVIAATPGSACSLNITGPLGLNIVEPGTVDSTGNLCGVPGGAILGIPIPGGLTCGQSIAIAGLSVNVVCPN